MRAVLWLCGSLLIISPNNRVEQNDSLYFGSCKKLVTTSITSSHLTTVVAGIQTYCDCTSDMQTCDPGRDVVNCVSSTSTSKGRQLSGICFYPVCWPNTHWYSNDTDSGNDSNGRQMTFSSSFYVFIIHCPIINCPNHQLPSFSTSLSLFFVDIIL